MGRMTDIKCYYATVLKDVRIQERASEPSRLYGLNRPRPACHPDRGIGLYWAAVQLKVLAHRSPYGRSLRLRLTFLVLTLSGPPYHM